MPVGSIAYSAGSTTVTRITAAATMAMIVDRSSCARARQLGAGGDVGVVHGVILRQRVDEIAGELVADQHEAGGHHDDVGGVGVAPEAVGAPPEAHDDQDGGERQKLADLDADVEGEQVRHADRRARCRTR